MTWQPASFTWPNSAEQMQRSAESVLSQVSNQADQSVGRLQALKGRVAFSRHALSSDAEALLDLRRQLDDLLMFGQVLCVYPYQHGVGSQSEHGHYLSPDEAITVLQTKLKDTADKYHPKGDLHVLGWMLAENTLGSFAQATNNLYQVVNVPELGLLSRRVNKEQSLQADKMTKPDTIVQPRFKPSAHINPEPVRLVERWQGAQIAQLESLAGDRQTPVDKLASLAVKRSAMLDTWSQNINELKQSGINLHKFEASGRADVIAAKLQKAKPPNRGHGYTFACLFISNKPLTFLSELFV